MTEGKTASLFSGVRTRLRTGLFRSAIYDWWLGRTPPRTVRALHSTSSQDAEASAYADGIFPMPSKTPSTPHDDFRWLALSGKTNTETGSKVMTWIDENTSWSVPAWRPDVVAERHVHWLHAFDQLSPFLSDEQQRGWALALVREAKHLGHVPDNGLPPWRRLRIRQARLFGALALTSTQNAEVHLREFGEEVDRQIMGDGGHIERNPARALAVLAMLVDSRNALRNFHVEPPQALGDAIDRMVPFIKALRHGDGGFALMNGATAVTADLIDRIIASTGSKGRAMSSAPHVGFHRLRAGQTTLILDCGRAGITDAVYRGTGAFELSVGKTRLIGNCGARLIDDTHQGAWKRALARTAAHSTLTIDDSDMGDATAATVSRREHDGARLIEATHDGYEDAYGASHRRSIYLDAVGMDIRGEDVLTGGRAAPVSVRFHLYPNVRASMVEGGGEVILKPQKGRGWRFQSHHPVMLEESVSFFDGRQHKSKQIVILGNHEPGSTTIKWRLAMEG